MFATIAKLLVKRLLIAIPILFFVSALLFMILRVLPVDPAAMSLPPNATIEEIEAKRTEMGLNLPLPQQYGIWLGQVAHGDFGSSIQLRTAVSRLIATTLPSTIELAVLSMQSAFAAGDLVGGITAGVLQLAEHARRPTMLHTEQSGM